MNEYHLSRTISAMLGKGNQNHNSRKFIANNVDPSRTSQNIEYINIINYLMKLYKDTTLNKREKIVLLKITTIR